MSVLTEATSSELVVPIPPSTVHRTVDRVADNTWIVTGWSVPYTTAFAAMEAIREEVERDARHPVRIQIRWRGVPAGFVAPTTGSLM